MAELLAQEKRKRKRQKSDRDYDDYEIHEIDSAPWIQHLDWA